MHCRLSHPNDARGVASRGQDLTPMPGAPPRALQKWRALVLHLYPQHEYGKTIHHNVAQHQPAPSCGGRHAVRPVGDGPEPLRGITRLAVRPRAQPNALTGWADLQDDPPQELLLEQVGAV